MFIILENWKLEMLKTKLMWGQISTMGVIVPTTIPATPSNSWPSPAEDKNVHFRLVDAIESLYFSNGMKKVINYKTALLFRRFFAHMWGVTF